MKKWLDASLRKGAGKFDPSEPWVRLVEEDLENLRESFIPEEGRIYSEFFVFFGFFRFLSYGVCCRLVEVVQNVETGFPLSVCVVLCLVSVRLCVIWGGRKCWVGWISPLGV